MSLTLLPGQGLGWDYRQAPNAPIPGAIGGYEYGGAQYLFLYQGSEFTVGDSKIHALKSTNLGATWTDTDNVNIPPMVAGTDPFAVCVYTTCMDGSTVYLMAVDLSGTGSGPTDTHTGPVLLFKYDLTTNSFSTSSISGAPTVWKFLNGGSYPPRSSVCLHLLRRGAGDMLLIYTGAPETIGANQWARIYVATFNGSSCGTGVILGAQASTVGAFREKCATLDASGNLHVILSHTGDTHSWYHVSMNSGGSFGTFQNIETDAYLGNNDTSNLLDFMASADTIAFLGTRNISSSNPNGDLAVYSALGGNLSPTWTFHNVLSGSPNVVPDPVIAPNWLASLGYLDGTLYAYWTQTGVAPSWSVSAKQGVIKGSTAAATNLTTWTVEASIMGPFDSGTVHWGASQVAVWSGPGIGLGVLGNFEGYDSGGSSDPIESSYLIIVPPAAAPPVVTCGSPPNGKVGVAYSHTFPASAGTPPYIFTITTGTLPPGLLLTGSSGSISGTPTLAGNYPITVTVTDAASATGTANCSLHIDLDLQCNNPPGGTVGVSYLHAIGIHGATPPYAFSITSGGLPSGLSIDPMSGVIFGTPTTAGTYGFRVSVSDVGGNTGNVSCSIIISMGIDCNNPPGGVLSHPYLHSLTISGAPTGSTVAITAGALPPGLTVDNTGLISGTPSLAGSYAFTATVTPPASLRSTRSFTPVTIGSSIQGYDISDNVCGGYAFAHGGAQYAFLRGGGLSTPEGDQKIHAFKSSDSGATWTELNAGGAISHPAVGGFGTAYAVGASGTTAYVIAARATNLDTGPVDDSFDGVGVTIFDLTTGVWGTTVNHSTPQVTVWHENPPGGPRRPSLQLVVLGPGNYLLFYGGPFEVLSGGSYGRAYCATFNGSTFGAEVMLPGQAGDLHSYTVVGAVAGSGGTAQLLFQKDDGLNTLYSVGRQSSGTFGTPQVVASDGYFHNTVDFSPPCLYQAGAVESIGVLGWINSATPAELHVFHAAMALNPAWQDSFTCAVVDDISGSPPTSPTYAVTVAQFANVGTPFSLSASAGTIWALWTTTAPLDTGSASRIWYCQADTATLTWTAPAMLVESAHQGSAPFVKPVASQVISWSGDGLGVIVLTQDYNSLAEAAELIVVGGGGGGGGTVGPASVACTITVASAGGGGGPSGSIDIVCGNPPGGTVGVPYNHTFPVIGATGPTTYSVVVGALPPGVHLDPVTGDLSGTPTAPGTYSFSIKVQQ